MICWLARRGSPLIHLTGMTMVVMKLIFGRNDRFVAITKRGFLELPPRILSFFFSGFAFPKRLMPNDDDDVHRLMDYERLICWIRTPQEKSSEREKLVPNLNDLFLSPLRWLQRLGADLCGKRSTAASRWVGCDTETSN